MDAANKTKYQAHKTNQRTYGLRPGNHVSQRSAWAMAVYYER